MDAFGSLARLNLLPAKTLNATGNSAVVDISGFQGQLAVTLDLGTGTGTTPALQILTQTSADATNLNWQNVSGLASAFTDFQNVGMNATYQEIALDTRDALRYMQLRFVIAGTNTPAYPASALIIGEKKYR